MPYLQTERAWKLLNVPTLTESITPKTCALTATESMGKSLTLPSASTVIEKPTQEACAKVATNKITTKENSFNPKERVNANIMKYK